MKKRQGLRQTRCFFAVKSAKKPVRSRSMSWMCR
nr:MAG TPA: hypothetical protein [Caudoviricetes sp.]